MSSSASQNWQCPLPISDYPKILLAHGGGGRLMHNLIDGIFVAAFGPDTLDTEHDGARLDPGCDKLAFTTDSYVVHPLFFPGGDIGSLAVYGTVNDLAMCGARPKYLSAGFIIEEGLETEALWRIAVSMRKAADRAKIGIVTGDTKVVDRGRGHGVYINTAGVGVVEHNLLIGPRRIREDDIVILNGDIGRHGIAIMAAREGLEFETTIESDCAPLADSVMRLIGEGVEVHCLRDLTRGGLATAAIEIAQSSGGSISLDEKSIPVSEPVRGACELLGYDPLYIANEGRYIAFVPKHQAQQALERMRQVMPETNPAVIGKVGPAGDRGEVTLKGIIGAERTLDMLSGEQLPRIC
jgi:hydrogenase expression/formation protein HypE